MWDVEPTQKNVSTDAPIYTAVEACSGHGGVDRRLLLRSGVKDIPKEQRIRTPQESIE